MSVSRVRNKNLKVWGQMAVQCLVCSDIVNHCTATVHYMIVLLHVQSRANVFVKHTTSSTSAEWGILTVVWQVVVLVWTLDHHTIWTLLVAGTYRHTAQHQWDMSGHNVHSNTTVVGHIGHMHGNWPMTACYFRLWVSEQDEPCNYYIHTDICTKCTYVYSFLYFL